MGKAATMAATAVVVAAAAVSIMLGSTHIASNDTPVEPEKKQVCPFPPVGWPSDEQAGIQGINTDDAWVYMDESLSRKQDSPSYYANVYTKKSQWEVPSTWKDLDEDERRITSLRGRMHYIFRHSVVDPSFNNFVNNVYNYGPNHVMCFSHRHHRTNTSSRPETEPQSSLGSDLNVWLNMTFGRFPSAWAPVLSAERSNDDAQEGQANGSESSQSHQCVEKDYGPQHTAVPLRSVSKTYVAAAFLAISERLAEDPSSLYDDAPTKDGSGKDVIRGAISAGVKRKIPVAEMVPPDASLPPLPLLTTSVVGDYFKPCGRLENATVAQLLSMAVMDDRNKAAWFREYYSPANLEKYGQLHGYDNSTGADPKLIPLDENGFPSQCDLEGIPLLDCISQILCPLYIQCEFCGEEHPDLFRVKASGDTDTGSFEIVRDYKTPEQRRKEEVVYDNFGYSLVDGMVLKATGFPLIHWIREVVLRPLNMAQSLRCLAPPSSPPEPRPGCWGTPRLNEAWSSGIEWVPWKGGELSPSWVSNTIISSSHDLMRFVGMLLGNGTLDGVKVLSPRGAEAALKEHNLGNIFQIGHMGMGMVTCRSSICGANTSTTHHIYDQLSEDGGAPPPVPGQWWGYGGSYCSRFIMLKDYGIGCVQMGYIPSVPYKKSNRLSARCHFSWRFIGQALRDYWP